MKKIVSIILTFVFVIGVCASAPITANAASVDDLTFEINEEGTMYQVKDCSGYASGELVIPSTYNGLPVTRIGSDAFRGVKNLESLIIPNSVTSIGDSAFSRCSSLISLNIPDGVTQIGDDTFYDCYSLIEISIPQSVESIGEDAFSGCKSLSKVHIKNLDAWIKIEFSTSASNPLYYAENLFLNGELVSEISIPDGLTKINPYIFCGCSFLKSVTIPNSVTSIGAGAFSGCSIIDLRIGDNVKYIGKGAFSLLKKIKSLYITDIVNWCAINFDHSDVGVMAFSNPMIGAENVYLNGELLTDLEIPDGVKEIRNGAFYNCSSLKTISLPEGLERIGYYAFAHCENLGEVIIPDTVSIIDCYAFVGCSALNEVNIGGNVTSIGVGAFYNCANLKKVVIPSSVEWISYCASATGNGVQFHNHSESIIKKAFGYKYDTWLEEIVKIDGFTISGVNGSAAEKYATENGFTFIETEAAEPHKHTYTSSVTKQPSYTETGVKTFICSCGDSYTEVIPKLEKFKAPTITSITSEKNGVKFTWEQVSGVEGYIVYKLVDGEYQQVAVQAQSNTVYVDKKAVNGNTYSYAVASMDRIGNPGELNEFSYKYEVPVVTSLATPVVKTSNTAAGIKVTWNAIENAENYTVYRRVYNESTKKYSGWTAIKTGYTGTSFTDTNVKFGIIYSYTVRAVNGDVRSSFKAATGTRVNVTPTVKVANASSGVKVTWNAVPNATGYTVYSASYNAKTKKWSGWTNRGTVKSGTTSWTDKKTKSGTYYKYTVRACYGTFKSSYKASDKIWYLAQPSVTVKAASNGVNVNWTQSAGAKTYTVYRAEYNAKTKKWSGWKNMGSLSKDKKSWTDKSAKKGVYYKYTVRAVNGNYKSTYKASANVKR